MGRILSWFSCGAASAVATKLSPDAVPVYCETGSEHPDNERFLADCERWFGRKVTRLRSRRFRDTWDVWRRQQYMVGVAGAPCTRDLKVTPRLEFQRPDDAHVFGYTADKSDQNRAKRLRQNYFELTIATPLIDRGLTKAACLALIERAGITLPPLYALADPRMLAIAKTHIQTGAMWAFRAVFQPDPVIPRRPSDYPPAAA